MSDMAKSVIAAVIVITLGGMNSVSAGLIRHDRADDLYTDLAAQSQFDPVGQLLFGGVGRASATLIGNGAEQWLLTAAHNFTIPAGEGSPLPSAVRFGTDETDAIEVALDHNQLYFANGGGIGPSDGNQPDLALIKLSKPISITPANLYNPKAFGTELGRIGTYVGFGLTGNGITGGDSSQQIDPNDMSSGLKFVKRAGQNVIDARGTLSDFGVALPPPPDCSDCPLPPSGEGTILDDVGLFPDEPNFLWADFDHPDDPSWNMTHASLPFGSAEQALDLEWSPDGGDSGGAMFLQFGNEWFLAGVVSGGADPFQLFDWVKNPDGQWVPVPVSGRRDDESVYGYGFGLSVAPVADHIDWIQSTLTPVPIPPAVGLFVSGILALTVPRIRSSRVGQAPGIETI